ncbi:hypothetical protein BCF55_1149 [Hydrogenivirga caldilitoris]|uniref:Uncharacterized protein n=1 Tax=Hydrogenivirga caldilitoris TaxID=246264 RepID=A0A497XRG4_9AQUI|nr:hypothetical protein [Hydrogenivirga caldilitoris]RLJ70864.1 hypothetical protein BCF55_1149 [Hydrogenivirga caldilitoris]
MKGLASVFLLLVFGVCPVFADVGLRSANPEELEVKILEKLFKDMLQRKEVNVLVLGDRKESYERNIREYSDKLRTVESCKEANILLIAGDTKSIPEECLNKPIFSTKKENINLFKNCLGAFYWKKGRPNIILIKERLEERGIRLPSEYERFIEPEDRVVGVERIK